MFCGPGGLTCRRRVGAISALLPKPPRRHPPPAGWGREVSARADPADVRVRQDPQALLQPTVRRLPLGAKAFGCGTGRMALAVVVNGAPAEDWHQTTSGLLSNLGWRTSCGSYSPPFGHSPTLVVPENPAAAARTGWHVTGTDLAMATTRRLVILRC